MKRRNLGTTDVSAIGLGCMGIAGVSGMAAMYGEGDKDEAVRTIHRALEIGIDFLDTAEVYGPYANEEFLGQALKGKRNKAFIATKFGFKIVDGRSRGTDSRPENIRAVCEASLKRLQTDVIDLYQIHAFDKNTPLDESLAALSKLVDQGKVRYLGCSNFAAWQLCKALWRAEVQGLHRLESIQPNYNLAIRDIEQEILPLCADQQIGVISYSPLGAGFLSGKYSKSWTAPAGTRFDIIPDHWAIYENPTSMNRMEKLRAKAAETGRSMVELALAWVLGQPGITTTLIGARNIGQVDQAFDAAAAGLSTELRAELNSW